MQQEIEFLSKIFAAKTSGIEFLGTSLNIAKQESSNGSTAAATMIQDLQKGLSKTQTTLKALLANSNITCEHHEKKQSDA